MKKKFICFILTLLSIFLLSFSCFASNLNTTDVLYSHGIFVYFNDRETLNYSRQIYDGGLKMEAYTNSPGYDKFNTLTYYWKFMRSSQVNADYLLRFKYEGFFTVLNDKNLSSYNVGLFITPESASNWSPVKIGDVRIVHTQDEDNVHYFDFFANVNYKFDSALDPNETYLIFFSVNLNTARAFDSTVMISHNEVTDYFLGSSHAPGTPQYPDDDTLNNKENDLENAEDNLLNSTDDGKTDFANILQNVLLLFPSITVFVTAFSKVIGYLIAFDFINILLYVSLAVGLCAFILGIVGKLHKRE